MVAFQVHWSSTPQSWKNKSRCFQKYGMATPQIINSKKWVLPENQPSILGETPLFLETGQKMMLDIYLANPLAKNVAYLYL